MDFKVGDKVRLKKIPYGYRESVLKNDYGLEVGGVYEVVALWGAGHVRIEGREGVVTGWYRQNFELVEEEEPMELYEEDKWYGWNGGECPVHPETLVEVSVDGTGVSRREAKTYIWKHAGFADIIAFKVIKHFVEPRQPREWDVVVTSNNNIYINAGSEVIKVREVLDE